MTTSSAALQLLFSPTLQYANDVFRVIFEQTGNGTGTRTKLASTIFKARKRSCGKVMFLHLSVNHSVHGGSPRQRPPPLDRPPPVRLRVSGTHPSGMNSCTLKFSHCNLSCGCTLTLALDCSRSRSQSRSRSNSV